MIKLSKIVLINWMYFSKTTLNIYGNSAIVGTNGSGKSTIIDAIQMILLGQKYSRFNANANAEKRTLESYVRGHIATNNCEYLRDSDVLTYIALEIEINNLKHTFGIHINYKSSNDKLSDPKYFYFNDILRQDLFIKDNKPLPFDIFNKNMKDIANYQTLSTLTMYQAKLKEILGLKNEDRYFKILSRAIGIKNINSCDAFMKDFVLDATKIDISGIKDNIISLNKISKIIEVTEEKLHDLEDLCNLGNRLTNIKETKKQLEAKDRLSRKRDLINDNEGLEFLKDDASENISNLQDLNDKLTSNKDDKYNYLTKLRAKLENINPNLANLKDKLRECENNKIKVDSKYDDLIKVINDNICDLELLVFNYEDLDNEIYSYLKAKDYESYKLQRLFKDYRNQLKDIKKYLEPSLKSLEEDLKVNNNKLDEYKKIRNDLKNNKFNYKKELENERRYLKDSLRDLYKKDIDVKLLAECLEITNEEYRNAIEGYLNDQRFYLLVEPSYYKDALNIINQNKDLVNIRLINTTKLKEYQSEEKTLSEFVKANDIYAKYYANYLLNKVHYVDNIFDLDKYDIAITKDAILYKNYVTYRINPRRYNIPYIGSNAFKIQISYFNDLILSYEQKNKEFTVSFTKLKNDLYYICNQIYFSTKLIEDNSYFNSINQLKELDDNIKELKEEIRILEQNNEFIETSQEITKCEAEIRKLDQEIKENNDKIGDYKANFNKYSIEIKENEKQLSNLELEINKLDENFIIIISDELNNYNREQIKKIIEENKREIYRLDKDDTTLNVHLENLMNNARNKYSLNIEPTYHNLAKFIEEKNNIDRDLFKHNNEFIKIKDDSKKLFINTFLSKLSNSIKEAENYVKSLNINLKNYRFGQDSYQIKIEDTDNRDLKLILDYAKRATDGEYNLFTNYNKKEDDQKVEQILSNYILSDDSNLKSYLIDYRNYLKFDVINKTLDGDKSLNKVIKTQSGGEVQVPFYILCGVAFQQTLDIERKKGNCLAIVLFDEAFDKMDSDRINSMLDFYKNKLNIQVILAAPGKLDALVDNVDSILAVVRDGKNAIVSDITYEV